MGRFVLERRQEIPRPLAEVFRFFANAQNLQEITPPFLHFQILTAGPIEMGAGTILDYRLRLYGLPQFWQTRIEKWSPPHQFVDVQVRGPYRFWRHTHTFYFRGDKTLMSDRVEYELPYGRLGWTVHALAVRRMLKRIFDYRSARIAELLGS